MKSKKKRIIRNADDFEEIYLPKYHKKKMEDLETPEETGERMAKESIDRIRKDFKRINKKSKPHLNPCKCRHPKCKKRAAYVISDNEPLSGFSLCCAEHIYKYICNAFEWNSWNKPEDDIVFVRRISRLNNKLRDNYYLRHKK